MDTRQHNNFSMGFTFIEVLIAVAIVTTLSTIALISFNTARVVHNLNTSTQNVLSVLRFAQARTLAGENDSVWGVHLASNQITLFQGNTYASSPLTQIYALPGSLQLTGILLNGGGSDVIFKRITGETDQTGTFILNVIADSSHSRSVTVDGSGKVYETTSFPSASVSRLVDTRHRSFTLGWSIKTATTLTLTFADPPSANTVQNIAMTSYFDPGKTKFDWSGTVTAGGIDQVLRIHTTTLTDTDTVLSVDRDCRKNNKKLTIAIDSKTIATYEADCTNITVGTFGGTIFEP